MKICVKSFKKCLQFMIFCVIVSNGLWFAAIAQQVERILGKDEVTSSNLVSSSTNHLRLAVTIENEVWLSLARAPR